MRAVKQADANGDGRVSATEFKAAYQHMAYEKTKDLRRNLMLMERIAGKLQPATGRVVSLEAQGSPHVASEFVKKMATVYSKEIKQLEDPEELPFRGPRWTKQED